MCQASSFFHPLQFMEVVFHPIHSHNREPRKPGSAPLAETLEEVTGKYWTQIVGNLLSSVRLFWRPVCLPASPTPECLVAVEELEFSVTPLISLMLFQWRVPVSQVLFTEFLFPILWNWVELNLEEGGSSVLEIFAIKTKKPQTSILGHTKPKVNRLIRDCKLQRIKEVVRLTTRPFLIHHEIHSLQVVYNLKMIVKMKQLPRLKPRWM